MFFALEWEYDATRGHGFLLKAFNPRPGGGLSHLRPGGDSVGEGGGVYQNDPI